jgi:hypothetical protein
MRRDMFGRRHHHPGIRADISAAERGIGELAEPDRDVDSLRDEIDIGVLAIEIDAKTGVLPAELDEKRRHHSAAEGDGGAYAQHAFEPIVLEADQAVRLLQFAQDRLAFLVIKRADLGDADPARVPVEEARPELPLERGHVLRDCRLGEAEIARGFREAACLDRPGEDLDAGQPVQRASKAPCQ